MKIKFYNNKKMRKFNTGATRDNCDNKPDYEGYLSPLVLKHYGEYMLKHQKQVNGTMRPSDNWKKGIPLEAYIKSTWRHFMDLWLHHNKYSDKTIETLEDSLCAILFNTMGYLHEILKANNNSSEKFKKTLKNLY